MQKIYMRQLMVHLTFGELGTVTAGSLASGFGTINIESDITTSTN